MTDHEDVERENRLSAIVHALAASDPTISYPETPRWHSWCTLCLTWLPIRPAPPDRHEVNCPWRLAVESEQTDQARVDA